MSAQFLFRLSSSCGSQLTFVSCFVWMRLLVFLLCLSPSSLHGFARALLPLLRSQLFGTRLAAHPCEVRYG
jgi:hypothetical protein